ncbi:MAG: P-II family nitrogen regulator [Candidatus Liptonbacteria bacterium]|nr:P-II family nitrogen regulator [Candidatus Liptonbacteria bacterium]
MKKIEAIIRPDKLEEVRQSLIDIGTTGLTISEVMGFGRQKGHTEIYRGSEYSTVFIPKIKLEIVAEDDRVADIIEAIIKSAKTKKIGDGKIFVSSVEEAVRIRTSERDTLAV